MHCNYVCVGVSGIYKIQTYLLISYIILNKRYNSQGFDNIGLLGLEAQNETLFSAWAAAGL